MTTRLLSIDELVAMKVFAGRHGKGWKAALRSAWENASEPGILQALRNDEGFGPAGLVAFRFPPVYKLLADERVVWTGSRKPTQADIDGAAGWANQRGWNGVDLDLCCDDKWLEFVKPSESVLS